MGHTIMLSSSGHVYAMGSNQQGQLGLGSSKQHCEDKNLPCLIESLQNVSVRDIAAGNDHSLALSKSGKQVYAWGQGKHGALGTSKSQNFYVPVSLDSVPDMVSMIAAGSKHSAFVSGQGDLYMFGNGAHGQLGLGEECVDKVFKPERVPGLKVLKVALGDTHSLALSTDGHLFTTGSNDKY